jgi:uncharacterized membrane protein YqjE
MPSNADDRSLGQMFADLSRETRILIQQEIHLARTELTEKASQMAKGVAFIVVGGVLAHGGVLALIATLILVLASIGIPRWLAALLATLIVSAAGYLLIRAGLGRLRVDALKPQQTIDSLKEDAQWLKNQTK